MVDEIPHAVDGVIPGAIGILRVEHEVEVRVRRSSQVPALAEHLRGAGQQKRPICRGVDHAAAVERRIASS